MVYAGARSTAPAYLSSAWVSVVLGSCESFYVDPQIRSLMLHEVRFRPQPVPDWRPLHLRLFIAASWLDGPSSGERPAYSAVDV